jgi:hypothetical protein
MYIIINARRMTQRWDMTAGRWQRKRKSRSHIDTIDSTKIFAYHL